MTRDEAIQKVRLATVSGTWEVGLVNALVALDLLVLDTQEESIKQAAARKIAGSQIVMRYGANDVVSYLTGNTATELIDILTRSGFKITR